MQKPRHRDQDQETLFAKQIKLYIDMIALTKKKERKIGGEKICCVCFAMPIGRVEGGGWSWWGRRRDFLRVPPTASISQHRPFSGNTESGNWAASFHWDYCKHLTFLNVQALQTSGQALVNLISLFSFCCFFFSIMIYAQPHPYLSELLCGSPVSRFNIKGRNFCLQGSTVCNRRKDS